jgi:predicted RNA-binding protein Jag
MNPYERRLVHVTVREFAGLETHSEGQGFLKAVTIRRTGS